MNPTLLRDAERVVRLTMVFILLTASISKFFSHGSFFSYYSVLFQKEDLRIRVSPLIIDFYLSVIPYIELLLGLALFSNTYKKIVIYGWFLFFWTLIEGHYILQEWSSVNEMLDYIFLGLLCLVLPHHQSWFQRDKISGRGGENFL